MITDSAKLDTFAELARHEVLHAIAIVAAAIIRGYADRPSPTDKFVILVDANKHGEAQLVHANSSHMATYITVLAESFLHQGQELLSSTCVSEEDVLAMNKFLADESNTPVTRFLCVQIARWIAINKLHVLPQLPQIKLIRAVLIWPTDRVFDALEEPIRRVIGTSLEVVREGAEAPELLLESLKLHKVTKLPTVEFGGLPPVDWPEAVPEVRLQ